MTPMSSKLDSSLRQGQGLSPSSPVLTQRRHTSLHGNSSLTRFNYHERKSTGRKASGPAIHTALVQESMKEVNELVDNISATDTREGQPLSIATSPVPGHLKQTEHSSNTLGSRVTAHDAQHNHGEGDSSIETSTSAATSKRTKSVKSNTKELPVRYEACDAKDLVHLIGEMLLDLIQINDRLPLQEDALTRFHSRVPPGISVMDYLQRLATHASLSPPILLSMVYYIDKLCALYPAFTITSLTVHRYLIASATVASKGLSDTFWTNSTYARVGGVSIKELGLLELELLRRVDWRIVPKPEILVEYYRSLVDRSEGFELATNNESTEVVNNEAVK